MKSATKESDVCAVVAPPCEGLGMDVGVDPDAAASARVEAARRRERGELFSLRDHLRGMVLAMLGANRPWRAIAENLQALDGVFGGFRPSYLRKADPAALSEAVKELRCGNARIGFQMRAIRPNLEVLERIEAEHGHLDAFLEERTAEEAAASLGRSGGRYKLREIGMPLALEYLRNVGVAVAERW